MKSTTGSKGEYKRLKPRGPLASPPPLSTTLVATLKLLESDLFELNREKGRLPVDKTKLVPLRRELPKGY